MNWDQVQDEWMQLRVPAGKTIRRKMEGVIECVSIPALLLGSAFTYFAASYEPLLNLTLFLTGSILAGRALRWKKYVLATGFVALAVAASTLPSGSKIFLLMGLACIAAGATVFAAFRTQPLPTI